MRAEEATSHTVYDFATDAFEISLLMRKTLFSFLSVYILLKIIFSLRVVGNPNHWVWIQFNRWEPHHGWTAYPIAWVKLLHCKKKVNDFHALSRDVTQQTLPGRE